MNNDINKSQCNDCKAVTPSNTVLLDEPSYIQCKGSAGNINIVTAAGTTIVYPIDAGETTLFRVKQVKLTDTTATTLYAIA